MGYDALLAELSAGSNVDLKEYGREGLERRLAHRMREAGFADPGAYAEHLHTRPVDREACRRGLSVHTTGFFRDPATWAYYARVLLPRLLEAKGDDGVIRAWSAGCSTGEEAYTLAAVFAEAAPEAFAAGRIRIFATDESNAAIATARTAAFPEAKLRATWPGWERWFEPRGGSYVVRALLRRAVVFARHDLLGDAPLGRQDLIVCRNTLIYFARAAATRVLGDLARALVPSGLLFAGRSEAVQVWSPSFQTTDREHRIFSKRARAPAPSPPPSEIPSWISPDRLQPRR